MQIPQTKLQKIKAGLHGAQALLIFTAACLTLAVMTKGGAIGGETGFYFALCFFTIPALIYQTMVPMWTRAWRLNNVYAFASIDIVFAILWFAASTAVAVWNANGIARGRSSDKESTDAKTNTRRDDNSTTKDGTCASFGYGSQSKCEVSKAAVGFGIIIFLTFTATAYLSIRTMIQYRKTGILPSASLQNHGSPEVVGPDDASKDVWSANTDELNVSDDHLPYGQNREDDREGLLHRPSVEHHHLANDLAHPGVPLSYQPPRDTDVSPVYNDSYAPSALSPTGLPLSPSGRLQFPDANYHSFRA